MRVIQRVGSDTDSLTGFIGHSSHRPGRSTTEELFHKLLWYNLDVAGVQSLSFMMIWWILGTKLDLQLRSDASLSAHRVKSGKLK